MTIQPRRSAKVAVMGVLALLAACAGGNNGPDQAEHDYRTRHPIGVDQALASLVMEFAPDGRGPSSDDLDRLARFAADHGKRGQGAIEIVVAGPNQGASEEAARSLAGALVRLGVERSDARLRIDGAPATRTTAVLTYRQPAARLPECGDWSDRADMNYTNTTSRNFGCSMQRNIGVMIADPRDLDRARAREGGEASRGVDVVNRYRRGEATPSAGKVEATTMGGTSGAQ